MEQNENPFQSNVVSQDNGKTAGIISYFTIIGWLIAFFAFHKDNKTELGSYQLRQTLLLNIVALVIYWVLGIITGALVLSTGFFGVIYLNYLVNIAIFVIWLIGLIGAINGQKKPIPLIGEKAQTLFTGI